MAMTRTFEVISDKFL